MAIKKFSEFTAGGAVVAGNFFVGLDGTTNKRWLASQLATYIANLIVDSAPGALDTLNELAAALGDDANFAATVTTALAGKQPIDADLTSIASVTSAADKMLYATGAQTWTVATLTAAGRALLDDADATTQRATLGVVIGTDVQAFNAKLAAISGVTMAADQIFYFTGAAAVAAMGFTSVARTLVAQTTQALMRTTGLGLGTSSIVDTGTSGTKVPLLDGVHTWSGVNTFSAVPVLSSGGISFPASQVASAGVNTLDDYEEGTFTPILRFGGLTTGITYGTQSGIYTKIGRKVFVDINILLTSKGTDVGNATIAGLPYNAAAGVPFPTSAWLGHALTTVAVPFCSVAAGSTTVALHDFTASGFAPLADTDFGNTTQIYISFNYTTA